EARVPRSGREAARRAAARAPHPRGRGARVVSGIDLTSTLIQFAVLLVSLTIHEAAHAWTADRLGDPTARLLGRVSLNPAVHVDPLGTIVLPLIAIISNFPVLGWAKPVPVNITRLRGHWKRKYMAIAAAGPASNLLLAIVASV